MPQLVLLAGPNGAGKSTVAAYLLPPSMTFLNADEMAKQLRTAETVTTGNADIEASRMLIRSMDDLASQRVDFAVETTLASRSLAPRIARLRESGYRFHLFFMWLPTPEIAMARVAERVQRGGHHIPEAVIRRRYMSGLENFFQLYQPIADTWRFYDNSRTRRAQLMASGTVRSRTASQWFALSEEYNAKKRR